MTGEARNKGGRPRLEVKRTEMLRIRVTEAERREIDEAARAAGEGLSRWARGRLLGGGKGGTETGGPLPSESGEAITIISQGDTLVVMKPVPAEVDHGAAIRAAMAQNDGETPPADAVMPVHFPDLPQVQAPYMQPPEAEPEPEVVWGASAAYPGGEETAEPVRRKLNPMKVSLQLEGAFEAPLWKEGGKWVDNDGKALAPQLVKALEKYIGAGLMALEEE